MYTDKFKLNVVFSTFQYVREQFLLHASSKWPCHGPLACHATNDVNIFQPYHEPFYGLHDLPFDALSCGG